MNLKNWLLGLLLTVCVAGPSQAFGTTQTAQPAATTKPTPTPTPVPLACGPFGDPLGTSTYVASSKPARKGGTLLTGVTDSLGNARFACLWKPVSASASNQLPLIVFLHGLGQTADNVMQATNILAYQKTMALNPTRPGFILLAPQSNLAKSNVLPFGQIGALNAKLLLGLSLWNIAYRQFSPAGSVTTDGATYAENPDAAVIDSFIAQEVATGQVDTTRIYLVGWSNGGSMTYLYGLNRPNIAAAAIYAGPSPFEQVLDFDPCPQLPTDQPAVDNWEVQVANPTLATWQIKNSCDWLTICRNEEILLHELAPIGTGIQDFFIEDNQSQSTGCEFECNDGLSSDATAIGGRGYKNHTRWPTNWTVPMLLFLGQHSLGSGS